MVYYYILLCSPLEIAKKMWESLTHIRLHASVILSQGEIIRKYGDINIFLGVLGVQFQS
jgi:hypothetical protein